MNKQSIERFRNKEVKLVREGYALYGIITEINEDCIIFETQTAISAISLDTIETIVLCNR